MAYLFEARELLVIPDSIQPKLGSTSEQQDAGTALGMFLSNDNYNLHDLRPTATTDEFNIFQNQQLVSLPVPGTILSRPSAAIYLPNQEGRLGDIKRQKDIKTHSLPGVRLRADADVLVIAQRMKKTAKYAVTAVLSLDYLPALEASVVRYGAY